MINIQILKKVRKKTSISIVECKRALEKNNWNYIKTLEWIKKNDFSDKNIDNYCILEKERILTEKNKNNNFISILKTRNEFVFNGNIFFNHAIETIRNIKVYKENNIIKYIKNSYLKSIFFNDLMKKHKNISKDEIILKELNIVKLRESEIEIYIHQKYCINIGIKGVSVFFSKGNISKVKNNILMNIFACHEVSIDTNGMCKLIIYREKSFLYNTFKKIKETKLETEFLIRKQISILFTKTVLLEQYCIIENKRIIGKIIGGISKKLLCYKKYNR